MAWIVEIEVYGGPNWLELDRFDITAKLPAGSSWPELQKAMLKTLLMERFHLVAHSDSRSLPAYIMTVGKRGLLKEADPEGQAQKGCRGKPRPQNAGPSTPVEVACHGMTAAEIAQNLHDMGDLRQPVVDSTELKGTYDYDVKWSPRFQLAAAGADAISMLDAAEKQLGLKLASLEKSPSFAGGGGGEGRPKAH